MPWFVSPAQCDHSDPALIKLIPMATLIALTWRAGGRVIAVADGHELTSASTLPLDERLDASAREGGFQTARRSHRSGGRSGPESQGPTGYCNGLGLEL
jgi:hypothetical protein